MNQEKVSVCRTEVKNKLIKNYSSWVKFRSLCTSEFVDNNFIHYINIELKLITYYNICSVCNHVVTYTYYHSQTLIKSFLITHVTRASDINSGVMTHCVFNSIIRKLQGVVSFNNMVDWERQNLLGLSRCNSWKLVLIFGISPHPSGWKLVWVIEWK